MPISCYDGESVSSLPRNLTSLTSPSSQVKIGKGIPGSIEWSPSKGVYRFEALKPVENLRELIALTK